MDSRTPRSGRGLTKILKKTKKGYVVYYLDDQRPRKIRDMSLRRFITFLLCVTFLGFICVQYVLMNRFLAHHHLMRPVPAKDIREAESFPKMRPESLALGMTSAAKGNKNATNKMPLQTTSLKGKEASATPRSTTKPEEGGTQSHNIVLPGISNSDAPRSSPTQAEGSRKVQILSTGGATLSSRRKSSIVFTRNQPEKDSPKTQEIVFVVVICRGHPDNIMTDVRRQVRQCEVMLKSAVAFTNSSIRVVVCTDAVEVFRVLVEVTSMWTAEHRSRVAFERRPVWFPAGRADLRNIRWPCSAAKLLQVEQLQDFDAVIYLDTDVIFMTPPEDLWAEFSAFDSIQTFAMAQEPPADPTDLQEHHQEPRHTPHGLNTGIMLINITRLKTFPGRGWIEEVVTTFDTFVTFMGSTPSNRLANAIFSQYPNLVRQLGCEWNYVSQLCQGGAVSCPQAWKRGVSALHGYGHHFYYDSPKFMAVYQAWKHYEMTTPPKQLLDALEANLASATSGRLWPGCESISGINHVFLNPLRRTINRYLVQRLRRLVAEVYESLGSNGGELELRENVGLV